MEQIWLAISVYVCWWHTYRDHTAPSKNHLLHISLISVHWSWLFMAALRRRCGHYIFVLFLSSVFFLLSFFFLFPSPNLSGRILDVYHTSTQSWCGHSANLECRCEMYCTQLAGNAGPKKSPKIRHLGTIAQLCRAISSQLRHVSTIGKKLLNSNTSSTCSVNMVNFGPLAAEICWRVWGTPANFNRFRVLAALLHDIPVLGVSQPLRR